MSAPVLERAPRALAGAPRRAELPFTLPAETGRVPALAAFALVLSRYRDREDVGVRVRTAAGEATVRVDASTNASARAFTARAGAALALALPGGGAEGAALFALDADEEEGGLTAGVALRIDGHAARTGALSFDRGRVRPAAAARFLAHLQVVLGALAAEPERGILELPLLTEGEREERIRWNATEAPLAHGVCLHRAFEAHVDAAPEAVAVLHGDEAVLYGELEARANRLAHHLRRRGVGPESRVGICVERGPRVLEAILGVLKAGGAYVPLDAAYPPERLAGMVRTAGIRVLVTEAGPGAALRVDGERIFLDRDADRVAAESAARPEGGATPDNLAYVIFTSGSTGEPKGIALAHRGVMNNLADLNGRHGVGPADRVLLLSSLSFDMSVYETLGILAAGGAVVIPRPDELRDPAAWAGLCRRHGVTLWNSAPALLGMLADHVEAHPEQAPAGLRLAFLGGDWVPVPLVDRVRAWAPRMRDFIVMGGATEASIHSIIQPVGEVDPGWRSIPYGVPMANQRAWVLDAHLREVPAGIAGELFLGGIGLARGYVGRAGFTAERFLPNPNGKPGTRIYRTGDRARQGDDGTIELLGRIDHQVKVRGFRIEPGEIEAALCRHPSVDRAVVVSRAEGGAAGLVAYLVAAGGAPPPDARALRDRLRETLPDYMVPGAFVTLDRLPLSPNGKVDRKRLPAPPAAAERAPYVAPRTPAEAALAEIWAEVLGAERVGADDDFFTLGGHSLSAARVAARVRERLGVQLALGEFFRVPLLAELAAAVEACGGGTAPAPIPRAPGDGPFPLAPAQRRLWLWAQMNPGQAAYNVPVALRLRGPVDAAVLERALDALVRRHAALRTAFAAEGGEPVQVVLPESPFALRVDALPAPADAAALRTRLAAEGARPFDLAAGPLFRALLLRGGGEPMLLLTLHHAVGDGWSVGILLRELGALYDAFSRGEPSPLAPLPLRYADYAVWHRERLARVEAAQLEWWRETLAGAPTLLELPTDRPRPAVQGHRGAQHPVRLSAALVERARALGRAEGATLHMVLLAALDVVLARHARAGEVVVGSAPAGRTHPDTEPLVGMFVNTLPVRADLSGDPDFRAFVRQVRERTLEAYDHQDVPFDRLVEALSPARSRSHAPLVQVAFAFQDAPARGLRLGGAAAEAEWVDLGTAQFDLTWLLDEDERGVAGVLEYATDLFDAATAERIAGRFRLLLEAAVSAPDRRVSALPLVDAAERERVLRDWSGAGGVFPVSGALHHRFEAHAAARPDAVALTCEGRSLAYGALNARANRLARRLARLGVGPEERVGVCAERTPELIVAILAVLKAGGAYVPLDPAYPAERLAYMAEDAGIRVLVAQPGVADRFAAEGVAVVSLDEELAGERDDDPGIDLDPSNLAYVIYTSGSTGRPKGVGVTHGNVLRLFASTDAAFGFGADDVWTLFHSCAFDFSVWEIWGALLHGGRLVVVPRDVSRDPARFRALLRSERVTVLNQTPSAFRALARADARQAEPLERLRTVVFGGEALQYESLRGWLDRYGPRRPRLVNMYGITETTVHVTRHAVTGAELRLGAAGSGVGTPIPDLRACVLDPAGEPAPVGIAGELHVGGAGLARGYLGRPGLTAQRFVPDPFSGDAGARLYRSGDLARWRADGTLEYLGRIDQQVKVRGFRIEPGEVESLLLAHPAVSAAAVVVRGEGDEAALAAYVVPAAGASPAAAALRDALRGQLPEHMVPGAFVTLDRIPLTANGKLDRAALPAPGAADAADDRQGAPRTPVEAVLAGIWCEVLRRERVGVDENFFELGGHSLLATRAAARIPEVFGVELSVAALFEAPTVAELAARVEALRHAGMPVPPPVARVERDGPAPLSFAQERLWFLHRLQPESAFFNHPTALRLSGALDVPALERALGGLVRRHAALRTTLREVEGAPVQVIAPFGGLALPVEALAGADRPAREAEAARRTEAEAERPFDLTAGPLFRPRLLRVDEDEHVLLLCMHHVVTDAWSTGVLLRELAALYEACRAGVEPALPEPAVEYADYAAWQRAHLSGPVLERQLSYWREALSGAPALLELPADHPRPAVQTYRGAHEAVALPAELARRLEALGRGEGATLFMVLLGAFQVLLAKYAGTADVVVGTTLAGRTRREVEELVGVFINALPLRTRLDGDPAFREVVRRVRRVTLGAYDHQEAPFERLVAELHPERTLSHAPLFQVLFELHDAAPGAALAGVAVQALEVETATAKYDLSLALTRSERGLHGRLTYAVDLWEPAAVRRMAAHLARVLEQVANDAELPLSRLRLTGDEERTQAAEARNRTAAADPAAGRCIHPLFEAQAARTPDAPAVTFGGGSLTYRELDARANRLANHLVRLGVGPEVRVGLCLERGMEMMPAILGVMKAGGAYVPVDPGHPAERIGYVLEDSAVAVLLTQARLRERLPVRAGVRVVCVDADEDAIARESAEAPSTGVTAENLCYVIYTSGSTGRPKGVAMHHRGVSNYIHWGTEAYGVGLGNGSPVFSSMAVDLTITNLLPLFAGRPVHLLPEENAVEALADAIRARPGFGAVKITPVHLSLLTPLLTADEARAAAHTLVIGADFLPAEATVWWQDNVPGVRLMNEYGPTETVVGCSAYTLPHRRHRAGAVPVGGPIRDLTFHVLDAHLEPMPVGIPGELYIGGVGVARGYLGRPGLSAEKFVPDPFAGGGARMYRTGDRARWQADDNLLILGRTDNQVKLRGYRVELGEIEAVLRRHEGVTGCLVVVREDEPGDRRLVAYVAGSAETAELREHLRRSLPEYMVPGAFVRLESMPQTATGKIDPRTLPAPRPEGAGEGFAAPRTPVEELLAAAWSEVLGVARVGTADGFFDLGGHSLLAMRIVSRVRQTLGVELPLRALFEGPTVAELAGVVEALRRDGLPILPRVVPVGRERPLPLSFAQERLWFLDRMEPGSTTYNIDWAIRLSGSLDVEALARALGEIVRRHESLRTTFREMDGAPVQVIAPFAGFALPVDDISRLSDAEREAEVRRRVADETARPFDLSAGPLFRAALLRLEDDGHVLLLGMHHAVSDGWSLGVLHRELSALYAAYREGGESPLGELPVQYADYAVWQREQVAGDLLDRQLAYWAERLAGAPALLELPTDHPRPAVQAYRGAVEPVALPAALLERLRALGRSEGATLYMVVLAAFQALLARYAGSEDVVVGSAIAGRGREEVEALIGFFVNTLALRTDLSGDPPFREVLRRVREATLGAWAHQDVPFERLVAELQPERSLSHSPLFQVMFSLDGAEAPVPGLAGLSVGAAEAGDGAAKFDLILALEAAPGGLRGALTYRTDLFERGTIERMVGHLGRVLEQAAARPEARLSELDLLSADERGLVLDAWNRTAAEVPADRCVHALFEAQAARTPGAVAVVFEEESLTYGALNARANRLAHSLAGLGVGPETRVALCLERGPEMVVSVLAVLKAGGAYVPLDPAYPAERLAFMLADAAVPVLVTQESLRAALSAGDGVRVVSVDGDGDRVAAQSAGNPERGVSPGQLAYVIYTSGSTGTPKGVLVQHRSLANLLAVTREAFGVGEGDVMPALASYAFDIWLFEALLPLISGAAVRLVERERVLDVPALLEEIADATLVHAVPALMRQLVQAERETPRLARLRRAFVGGDRVAADLLAEMRETFSRAETHVLYGPTEGTILASTHPVPEDGIVEGHPIGHPLGNVRLYVCDGLGSPQPAGVPGELLIGGAGVARGYLGRSAMTAERFVPDPFSSEGGARLYRTGDRARWRADGTLEYLGRLDGQVKARGFRIEPGEIEAVLRGHERVTDCVVVAREDVPGDQRLVAYVAGGAEADELREHLRRSLPEYMVPAAFVVLEALPLTPNGKLDRRALPAPVYAAEADRYAAPRTPAEEVLAGIWAAVLRLERVGVDENFFDLGGHSLLATRVVSRVREVFGVELPLRALFERPTVAELAVGVEEMRRAELPVLPPVVPVERAGALPLSFAQERLWFIDRLEPGSTVYNMPLAWRLGGALDEAALERSLGEIVRRHEALRTVFAEVDGSPVQVIAPFGAFALPVEDLSELSEADREAALRRHVGEEARRAFDLSAGPLFQAGLLRLGEEDHVLLLSMHHIVSDEWSMGVLFRELSALYAAYREGGESPLPELPVQYADHAVWQREQLAGDLLDRQLAYWTERLAGAPALLELPTDHPRPAAQGYHGASEPVELPAALLERLRALGRSEGATLYMVLLAAFQLLLARYAGSADVVVGSPIAGRSRGEVEELIGFFANMLALRTELSGDPGFREVLRRVREVTLGAYEHQEVPFERLVAELQPERSLGYSPLFQVTFALEDDVALPGGFPGLRSESIDAELGIAKFDLALSLETHASGLAGTLVYRTDLFERGTIVRMRGHLARVLEQVAEDAEVRLSRLELLGIDERRTLIEAWNQTERPYPRGVCIHDLFAAQVQARPDAEALAWGGARLTYAELDARANRLAHHLARRGVGPESRVGVLLERGVELIVSILGILKAGGAYVPLDPTYPAERLELMLADAGVRVLLTRRDLAAPLNARGVDCVCLDASGDALAAESAEAPISLAAPDGLAYIVYTSGSTGRPKGVMVGHRHVVQLVCETDYVRLGPGDRVAQASNASFDALTFEAWGALLNGATLVGIDRDVLLSAPALREVLRERGITTLYQTTALLNQLSREEPDIFAPLREVLFGGEAVDAESVRRILRAGKPRRLLHVYGPTEITAWCSCEQVEQVDEDALTVSIGRPTGNQRIYLLDAALRPVPIGVPGEAYVGGDGVVRGYLGRPGLTAERFVPDPFAAEPGARMYRTGDRMRWKESTSAEVRECGSASDSRDTQRTPALPHSRTAVLEFVGRLDDQVKIRGFRIEPGEVESVLSALPAVREARVIVREDEPGEKRLVAYVVGEIDPDDLRSHLRKSLPEYMMPGAFVTLGSLPLTAVGKLDVKALPAPGFGAEDGYVAPRTPVEEVLAAIWAELLRLERVGIHDDFFERGGHSLLATRVVSRIRAVFSVELPLRALFEGPTVAALADAVEALRRDGLPILPPVVPVGRDRALPLSFAQERLWFLDRMKPESSVYNMYAPLRLSGALDVGALERALGEIVRRHESLRTTFAEVDGAPVQVIAPFAGFALAVEDVSGPGEAEARRRIADEASRPFDLSAGPLFRAALLRLGEEEHVLLLGMHHAVSDGWSLGVLHRELSALYAAYRDGAGSPLDALPVQYADYAVWQREQLAGDLLDRQLAWWRDRLAGAPALLELPTDHPRPAVQAFDGAQVPLALPAGVLEPLRALGRAEGATLFMVLLGAFQVLLSRYGAGDDVVVGSPVAGRTRAEVEGLVGFFVNTLALRTDLSGDPPFREVLRRVREATLGAWEHQEVPFERLVAELQPERSLSHSPLFQVVFTLQNGDAAESGIPGLGVEPVEVDEDVAKFDLTLGMEAAADGLRGALAYRTDLFERATVERMASHLARVLEQVAEDAELRLSQLELLGGDERRLVLEGWSVADAPYPDEPCVHARIRAQASRTPDAPAVVFGERSLTYRELDARAGRIARWLRRRGVGPDVPVGVCLERSPELVVAMLGVMKAGGAYVALDPAYPADRLDSMLADSGVAVLLTQASLRGALPARAGIEVASVDGAWDDAAPEPGEPLDGGAGPRNLAYVIYTSGSTGTPKGVGVEHAGLANLCAWHAAAFAVTPTDRATQLASPGFDASAWEVWPYLTRGACVDVVPQEVRGDPAALRDFLVRRAVTVAFVPTPIAEPLLGLAWPAETALRWLLAGGDRLQARPGPGIPFALGNNYGPTEFTVVATSGRVAPDGAGAPSIGTPVHNARCYVLSPSLRPLPAGVPGELYVGGAQVARGYRGRPALTAARFVPDPFAAEPGARMYRTGDRVRWTYESAEVRECGSALDPREPQRTPALPHSRTAVLEYLGRLDEQVKIRGFRIEPGEVEAALRLHPGVRDCVVVVREDAPGEKRLAAYVVGGEEPAALRAHLRRLLPDYMVPAAVTTLDALPLTTGGKVDRRALPIPAAAAAEPGRRQEPGTRLEARLAALWSEVLGVEAVGVEDNFFDLGGHSLLLVRLQARLAAELGRAVPVVELFQYPTVRALGTWLQGTADTAAVDEGEERGEARQTGAGRLAARRAARAPRPA